MVAAIKWFNFKPLSHIEVITVTVPAKNNIIINIHLPTKAIDMIQNSCGETAVPKIKRIKIFIASPCTFYKKIPEYGKVLTIFNEGLSYRCNNI